MIRAVVAALLALTLQAKAAPNIVVIMTDDQTVADLAVMTRTQRLIADTGVTFSNSFVDYPLCCPSRATFLTGQAAHNHGVLGNTPIMNGGYEAFRPNEAETLPVWLQRAGYTTWHFGKYMNGYHRHATDSPHVPPGWNHWFGKVHYTAYEFYDYDLNENGTLVRYGCRVSDYETDVILRKASAFIGAQKDKQKPFFMWLAPLAPHAGGLGGCANYTKALGAQPAERHRGSFASAPFARPHSFNETDVSDKPSFIRNLPSLNAAEIHQAHKGTINRREALLAVDEMVARIVQKLKMVGKYEDTCLIFTSDNGYLAGEHRVADGKEVPYEESIRVPLIISCPGMPAGAKLPHLVNNTDLAATILDLAGAQPAGRSLNGKSLLPIIQDPLTPWRTALLIQGSVPSRFETVPGLIRYHGVRSHDAKYIEYGNGEREFYYLRNHLNETRNHSADPTAYPRVKSSLKKALDILRTCAGESCWMSSLPSP